jgi:hypothetical protein
MIVSGGAQLVGHVGDQLAAQFLRFAQALTPSSLSACVSWPISSLRGPGVRTE